MHNDENPVDTVITLIGSALALIVLFAACSAAPDALLAITH